MPTSVHIPKGLLEIVDKKARALGVSRNQLIVRAVERDVTAASEWSPGFFERLAAVDMTTARAVGDMLAAVRARRTSKEPVTL